MNVFNSVRPAPFDIRPVATWMLGEIASRSADNEGISRPAFSEIETETLKFLIDFAKSQGLVATWDPGRNVIFCLPAHTDAVKYILVGSHVDSVPSGGNFDGLAGVVAGISCLVRAKCEGRVFPQPVKVIAMRGEESAWFGPCYIGSKALLGVLSEEELAARHRLDGRSLEEHMAALGIDTASIRNGRPLIDANTIQAYVEVHIEQGPVLIASNQPAAIVSGIRGNFRYKKIVCFGEAGHSGAVPLAYRHDPVLAMAELLNVLDTAWRNFVANGADLVVTSGMVTTDMHKHALARIPDRVQFSLDVRSQDPDMLRTMNDLVLKHVARIEKERGVRFDLDEVLWTDPATCNMHIIARLRNEAVSIGLEPRLISSGGGHDAAVFSQAGVPTGMIFIRNQHGSHNPHEAMDIDDFYVATSVLYNFLNT